MVLKHVPKTSHFKRTVLSRYWELEDRKNPVTITFYVFWFSSIKMVIKIFTFFCVFKLPLNYNCKFKKMKKMKIENTFFTFAIKGEVFWTFRIVGIRFHRIYSILWSSWSENTLPTENYQHSLATKVTVWQGPQWVQSYWSIRITQTHVPKLLHQVLSESGELRALSIFLLAGLGGFSFFDFHLPRFILFSFFIHGLQLKFICKVKYTSMWKF